MELFIGITIGIVSTAFILLIDSWIQKKNYLCEYPHDHFHTVSSNKRIMRFDFTPEQLDSLVGYTITRVNYDKEHSVFPIELWVKKDNEEELWGGLSMYESRVIFINEDNKVYEKSL